MRRIAVFFCVACAILLHAGFLLFGGALVPAAKPDLGSLQEVELLDETPEKDKPDEPPPEDEKELETQDEAPPDATEIIEKMESPVNNDAPALEAASLSAIEAALNGQGGSGDFSTALSFTSGGRIGGTGKAGGGEGGGDDVFSLAEIDQPPRAIFQGSPAYPPEMRGKKVEGVVSVIFIVDATGKVSSARVERSSNPVFEKPALDAVKKWKFEPGVKGGQRVACRSRVPVRFPAR